MKKEGILSLARDNRRLQKRNAILAEQLAVETAIKERLSEELNSWRELMRKDYE